MNQREQAWQQIRTEYQTEIALQHWQPLIDAIGQNDAREALTYIEMFLTGILDGLRDALRTLE
jgi:hypothetical protein